MTAFGRIWSRAVPLAMAGAVGWLAACYHYGVAPDMIVPLPEAQVETAGAANGIDGYIETDAAIAPGGYAGALVDAAGRLIGVTALTIATGDEQPGIRPAVPAIMLKWGNP